MVSTDEVLKGNVFKSLLKVLRHFFGTTTQTIISRLEKDTELNIKDLCARPDLLSDILSRVLGDASKTVEKYVLKDLSDELSLEFTDNDSRSFAEKISGLRDAIKENVILKEIRW